MITLTSWRAPGSRYFCYLKSHSNSAFLSIFFLKFRDYVCSECILIIYKCECYWNSGFVLLTNSTNFLLSPRRLSFPTVAKRESYKYVESFDKSAIGHSTILHCEETVADSKYSEFNPGCGSVISRECGDPEEALKSVSLLLEIGL